MSDMEKLSRNMTRKQMEAWLALEGHNVVMSNALVMRKANGRRRIIAARKDESISWGDVSDTELRMAYNLLSSENEL